MRVCPWLSVVHHVNWRLERRTRCACRLSSTVLHAAEAGTRPRSEWHTGAMRIAMPGSAVTAPYPRRPPRLASWDRRWHSGEARRLTSLSWLLVPKVGVAPSKRVQHFDAEILEAAQQKADTCSRRCCRHGHGHFQASGQFLAARLTWD